MSRTSKSLRASFVALVASSALTFSCNNGGGGGGGSDPAAPGPGTPAAQPTTNNPTVGSDPTPTPGANADPISTLVTIAGNLALTTGSSGGAGLNLQGSGTQYWVKCVTLDLTSLSACIDDTDSNGAFSLSCNGFKGKKFGCFILSGTDANNLSVKGIVSSDDLAAGEETSSAALDISFDPQSGATEVANFKPKKEDGNEDTAAAAVAATLDGALAALDIDSGAYKVCRSNFDQNKTDAEIKNDIGTLNFNSCPGFTENQYIHFTPASGSTPPRFEMWNREADRTACVQNDNSILYHISDGSRSVSFTKDNVTFDNLWAAVYNTDGTNAWAPQAAVKAYQAALAEGSAGDSESEQIKSDLEAAFGVGNACEGLIDALITSTANVTIESVNGFKQCSAWDWNSGNADFDSSMDKGDPFGQWCVEYNSAPTTCPDGDDRCRTKNMVRDQQVGACKGHLEGGASEDDWQKQGIVWEFLNAMSQLRHQGGDARFEGLLRNFGLAADAGFDFSYTGCGPQDNSCALDSWGTTCTGLTDDQKNSLAALVIAWADSDWNFERSNYLRAAVDQNGALKCDAISINRYGQTITSINVGGNDVPLSNALVLLKIILENPWHQGDQAGITALEQQVCNASGGEWDFTGLATHTAQAFLDNLEQTQFDFQFDSSLSDAQKKAVIQALFVGARDGYDGNDDSDYNDPGEGPGVKGCGLVRIRDINQQAQAFGGGGGGIGGGGGQGPNLDEYARWIGWSLQEYVQQEELQGLSDLTENLTADAAGLQQLVEETMEFAIGNINHYSWLLGDMCEFFDIANVNIANIDGLNEAVSCNSAWPSSLSSQSQMCQQQGDFNPCQFRQYRDDENWTTAQRFNSLARRVTEIVGRNAFRNDREYAKVKAAIFANSDCMPDASLSQDQILVNDQLTFGVSIRGPVKRKFSAFVRLDPTRESTDTVVKYNIQDARIEKQQGFNGSCYWGETQTLSGVTVVDGVILGQFSHGFVDTCRNAGDGDQNSEGGGGGENNNQFREGFLATPDNGQNI